LKRVCLIRHGFYPADSRVRKEALALIERGFSVDVICLRKSGEEKRSCVDGVEVYRIPLDHHRGGKIGYVIEYLRSYLMIAALLPVLFFRKRYDVIQVNTMPDFLVFVTLLPKLLGAKVIIDMHEAMPEMFRCKFGYEMSHPLIRLLGLIERMATSYADRVLVVSESIMPFYQSRGIDLSKVVLVPNSPEDRLFDLSRYRPSENRDSIETKGSVASRGDFVLLSHGTLEKRYGIQVMIRALPLIRETIPEARVLVAGEGEFSDRLKETAREGGVEDHVTFTGLVPFGQIPKVILSADICFVPLISDEFTNIMAPNKLYEYVSMKRPVIATNTTGMREFFDDSCVVYVPSDDEEALAQAVVQLYQNPARAESMVQNAWDAFQDVKWDAVKRRYSDSFLF